MPYALTHKQETRERHFDTKEELCSHAALQFLCSGTPERWQSKHVDQSCIVTPIPSRFARLPPSTGGGLR
jgi:hypothetical protein